MTVKTSAKRVVKSSAMKSKLNNLLKQQVLVSKKSSGNKSGNNTGNKSGNKSGMGRSIALSTGVLKKNPSTASAHTEIMNRRSSAVNVTVMVINWDSDSPVTIGNTSVSIPANSLRSFSTSLTGVADHYEVIVILSTSSNVIVNHFGVVNNVPQVGNVVLDRDFISIRV